MGQLMKVPIESIRENPVALRPVNREDEAYKGLVASIKEKGFFGAITGREKKDGEKVFYELVDGLQRFNAAKDAGITEINMDVITLDDEKVLEAQIMANIHRVETRPVEYSRQLQRLMLQNPLLTSYELAKRLGKSPQWISERLGLAKITDDGICELINNGKIKLANAYALSKLPPNEQKDYVDRAMTMGVEQFVPIVDDRVREVRAARRAGKAAEKTEFQPTMHLQKSSLIKEEIKQGAVADRLIKSTKIKTAAEGFRLALQWVMHVDPISAQEQVDKHNQQVKERQEIKAKKKAAREKAAAEAQAALA